MTTAKRIERLNNSALRTIEVSVPDEEDVVAQIAKVAHGLIELRV